MKIRKGFVSNSSRSSFVCDTRRRYCNDDDPEKNKMTKVDEAEALMHDLVKLSNKYKLGLTKDSYEIHVCTKEEEKDLVESWNYNEARGATGCVVVNSTGDNSIPYEFFEIIQRVLHSVRFHLG